MPNIETFNGIKANMFYDEHMPSHVHFEYGDFEILLVIIDGSVYKGWLPAPQLRKSKAWLKRNQNDCESIFKLFNPELYAPRKTTSKNPGRKKR